MPYRVEKKGTKFCVYDDKGKVVGEHDTRRDAIKQLRALMANVPDAKKKGSVKKKKSDEGEHEYR